MAGSLKCAISAHLSAQALAIVQRAILWAGRVVALRGGPVSKLIGQEGGPRASVAEDEAAAALEELEAKAEELAGVMRVKQCSIKAIAVEKSVEQREALGHSCFMFLDAAPRATASCTDGRMGYPALYPAAFLKAD